jgi:hypothetical protein
MMPFEGGGAFLPKSTIGATGRNRKLDPSSFLGFGPSSCCKRASGIIKGIQQNQEEEQWADGDTSSSGTSYSA